MNATIWKVDEEEKIFFCKMMSKSALGIAAAGAGICFIGYCIYFDHKRRHDPNFKEKLRERRRKAKSAENKSSGSEIPDLKDAEAMQRFFLQEVQVGEELLAAGDIESAVEHLSNAVAVCNQPHQLLQVLQQSLPPQVFQLLTQRLPSVTQRMASRNTSPTMIEDDLE